ncbi:unnamed protein product [Sphagnum balticum]
MHTEADEYRSVAVKRIRELAKHEILGQDKPTLCTRETVVLTTFNDMVRCVASAGDRAILHTGKVFSHPRPRTLDDLRERIASVIARITDDMLKRVADNLILRATACVMVDGAHLDTVVDE